MTQLSSRLALCLFLTLISNLIDDRAACQERAFRIAQIIPDNSLGSEDSRTRPSTIKNTPSDVIEGGATRGSNLFHSFREFSIKEGRGAYFANPDVIQNIFTRVTGGNVSNILGTLGVLGNANLFLINPSGIIFGPNARLDIGGAFISSTADSLLFDNNFEFSATNLDAPPLLTVNIPIGLKFREQAADISSTANLVTPGNLTLKAGNLNLSGSLDSGGDLTLEALETLTIRDSIISPFIAASSRNLLLQGNQNVDIYTLNHPQSGLISGGDLTLRSANAVSGDAHFWSGGSFRIEKLDGSLGGLVSIEDPVIRSLGDVKFNAYQGASLHILAAGSVEIPVGVRITGVDPVNGIVETVTLSDETTVNIDGRGEPTLDIRAGVDPTVVGGFFFNPLDFFPFNPNSSNGIFNPNLGDFPSFSAAPTSADINIGTIVFTDFSGNPVAGKILLTNQYQPNPALTGNIEVSATQGSFLTGVASRTGDFNSGGALVIDSRGEISVNGINRVSAAPVGFLPSGNPVFQGNGGEVTFLSNGDITLTPGSSIIANGLLGGNITLKSKEAISLTSGTIISNSYTVVPDAMGGDIVITGRSLSLTRGSKLLTSTFGRGNAGNISVEVADHVTIFNSDIDSTVEAGAVGNTGTINLQAGSLSLTNGGLILTIVRSAGQGNAGSINLNVRDTVTIDGVNNRFPSGVYSVLNTGATGNSGDINIQAGLLSLTNGTQIDTSTFGVGNAGNITVTATNKVSLDGSGSRIRSVVGFTDIDGDGNIDVRGQGRGGDINIKVEDGSLSLTDGAVLNATTFGQGDAGNITVQADQVSLDGFKVIDNSIVRRTFPSAIISGVALGAIGQGGNITIKASSLSLTGGAGLFAATQGQAGTDGRLANAGNIIIEASDSVTGSGGSVISSSTFGQGNAGNIIINSPDAIVSFDGVGMIPPEFSPSGEIVSTLTSSGIDSVVAFLTGFTGDRRGGDINIQARSLSLTNGASLNAGTYGQGNAGNINIKIDKTAVLDRSSNIFSAVESGGVGNAGTIELNADSLSLTNGSQILTIVRRAPQSLDGTEIPAGRGNGGNVKIKAHDMILDGFALDEFNNPLSSEIASLIDMGAAGTAGNIDIQATNALILSNGAAINSALSFNAIGRGGDITITGRSLSLTNNAQIIASTFGQGEAGKIIITANSLTSTNRSSIQTNTSSSSKAGDLVFTLQDYLTLTDSAIEASTDPNSTGDGGSISLNPITVTLTDGARISVNNQGLGNGGNISLFAQNLTLNNGSSISATTASGEGGNITLNVPNTISQSTNSPISATAGGTGNGGNITIKTQFLIGNDNSDITANAYSGTGGNINITADGIFRNPNSEITASSQLGIDGVIETDTPEVDPSRGLINLPQNLVDPNALISQNACREGNTSEFTVRGRGGLPSTPEQVQSSNEVEVGLVGATEQEATTKPVTVTSATRKIVPAQGWRRNDKGEMVLVAYSTADGTNRQVTSPANCLSN